MRANPFSKVIGDLLDSSTPLEEVEVSEQLAILYEELLANIVKDQHFKNEKPTTIDGGIALSSQHALDCLQDPLRTARFIKGVYAAILDSFQVFPNGKINILYAGCGPGAPLLLPLLSLFDQDKISVTLLDLNESSLSSIKTLISHLEFENYFSDFVCTDATRYIFPKEVPLHLLVSETMDKALTIEPQVSITQNLAPQLMDKGILIPEKIEIFAEHTFYSKEPYFDINKDIFKLPPIRNTINIQSLFSITKEIPSSPFFSFRSEWITIPENFKETPDISIFAEIQIYNGIVLSKSESLLSNPYCVDSLYNLKSDSYQLMYDSRGIPSWSYTEEEE